MVVGPASENLSEMSTITGYRDVTSLEVHTEVYWSGTNRSYIVKRNNNNCINFSMSLKASFPICFQDHPPIFLLPHSDPSHKTILFSLEVSKKLESKNKMSWNKKQSKIIGCFTYCCFVSHPDVAEKKKTHKRKQIGHVYKLNLIIFIEKNKSLRNADVWLALIGMKVVAGLLFSFS